MNGTEDLIGCRDSDFDQYGDIYAFGDYPEVQCSSAFCWFLADLYSGNAKYLSLALSKTVYVSGNLRFANASSISPAYKSRCLTLMDSAWTRVRKSL